MNRRFVAFVFAFASFPILVGAQGSVVVRIDDPLGSHCIDATSEEVTLHVRRIFMETTQGLFSEDNRAGVLTLVKLTGRSRGPIVEVQVPSITLVDVQNERSGRLSLPLEYQIASSLALNQDGVVTTDMALSLSLAKTQGSKGFGEILVVASKALSKLSISGNPFEQAGSKFLAFANDAINVGNGKQLTVPFAELSLTFNKGDQPLDRCKAEGKERTGAIAVLRSRGAEHAELIPMTNTEELYCFRYSSESTYEVLAARRTGETCPADRAAYQAINNDYVMLVISAGPIRRDSGRDARHADVFDKVRRDDRDMVWSTAFEKTYQDHKPDARWSFPPPTGSEQEQHIQESIKRCAALGLEPKACGVREPILAIQP
ncbi:MAG TPA: hypothetical protein VNW97_08345 [Candidatus Saccharimonadales bacterium]|jgi:hypothetical protein|nr:hypothetical protein [Candidatus Saccharimonadales bacterium]